jgi:hypothetical protein
VRTWITISFLTCYIVLTPVSWSLAVAYVWEMVADIVTDIMILCWIICTNNTNDHYIYDEV